MKKTNRHILYISHGGGPLPLLGDERHIEMIEQLKRLSTKIPKPSAILLTSAHWEEAVPTITSAANPPLIYDYYGFPKESYDIKYPCPGEPVLAKQISDKLGTAGIKNNLDEKRGFDHGLFVPLKIMYPNADIPCVQLSLLKKLNPADHIKLGTALSSLEYDNLLIIGSGFSFHNMKAFFETDTFDNKIKNEQFEHWLIETCSNTNIDETERTNRLTNWEKAPHARYCHPREEHFLPLHVCYGVASSACTEHIELKILDKKASFYLW